MDNIAVLQKVVDETSRLVDNVEPGQLGSPSPCEGWTVRDVINHITGGATMFAVSVEEGAVPDDLLGRLMGGDNLGDDPQGAWAKASDRAIAAFGIPGALDKIVTLPFGQMPAGIALSIAVFDVATHACDIAQGTGQSVNDTATFEAALETGKQMIGPELRAPGLFDAEQPAPADAPIAQRLLAFGGRRI